jgi:hypothetical protein
MDRRQALPLVVSAALLATLGAFTLADRDAKPLPDPEARGRTGPTQAVDIYAASGDDERFSRPRAEERPDDPQADGHGAHPAGRPPAPGGAASPPAGGPPMAHDVPEGWERRTPASPMRWAEFGLPGEGPAEVVVFWFGEGGGGSVDHNLERWKGQVEATAPPVVDTFGLGDGVRVTTLAVEGTITSAMGANPAFLGQPGFALHGAVIECPKGPLFVKAMGPAATLRAQSDAFLAFLRSFRVVE